MTDTAIYGTQGNEMQNMDAAQGGVQAMQPEVAGAEAPQAAEIAEAQKTGVVNMADKRAEKEAEQKSANYTHKFKKPVTIGGTTYSTLTFYFDRLTGRDIEAIESELQDQNKYVLSPEVSSIFQSMLAARAAGIASDDISNLPIADYMKIKNKARDFLVNAGY